MDKDELEDYTDNPYEVLGVPQDATSIQIKKAYRKLALDHHPDRQTNDVDRAKAQTKFAQIAMAYEVLNDPELRKEYDKLKKEADQEAAAQKGGNSKASKKKYHPPAGFRPHFNDPYEVWKRDFKEVYGFDYPGAEYDFIADDGKTTQPQKPAPRAGNMFTAGGASPPPPPGGKSGSSSNGGSKYVPPNSTAIVKHDKNAHAIVEAEPMPTGKNNRPIAMEVKTRQEGPITITETTFKRPDGSTETVTTRTGIPGPKPEKEKMKMIEGPEEKKMIEGPKQRKLLGWGGGKKDKNAAAAEPAKKEDKPKKERKMLANEAHSEGTEQKARRGLFGFGKAKQ